MFCKRSIEIRLIGGAFELSTSRKSGKDSAGDFLVLAIDDGIVSFKMGAVTGVLFLVLRKHENMAFGRWPCWKLLRQVRGYGNHVPIYTFEFQNSSHLPLSA